ncbi:MAG TPA: LPS assembly protein LptD [Caulobacteraceae bacterium]|nr:LPS assembly protein LptD [Caulobacteraceae bacterium]
MTRTALLAGVALAFLATAGQARTLASMAAPAKAPPASAPDDGLGQQGFFLEADSLLRNEEAHRVIAEGNVEARYRGRVVRADSLDYDTQSGAVVAKGHVKIIAADGTAQFADYITLDKSMSEGFATGFSTRLQNDVKIAAARTVRRSADVMEFDHAIYTPCEACSRDGRAPTWSIRARQAIENKRKKTLFFRDATVRVLGLDVLYLPALPAADPAADRKSGLLLPIVTVSGIRGFSWDQPYYQVISPSQDLTVTPQINARVNPFITAEWRARFYSGLTDVRVGYTYDRDFTSGGDKFGQATSRSFVLASGQFQIDSKWSWGFTAERASDPLIFDKYSVPDVFVDRGLYVADNRRLISQLDLERQDSQSYLSIAAISVQGLRTNDAQSAMPTIAPLIEGRWEAPTPILGGRLRVLGSAVALSQDQSAANAGFAGQGLDPGVDSRRATAQLDWQGNFTLQNGLRVQPFLDGRGDLYSVTNIAGSGRDAVISRGFGAAGATFTYPLIRTAPSATWIIEPIVQAVAANMQKYDPRIPNADSLNFNLDETNLFNADRSPGYDIYEGGESVTAGGRATVLFNDGRSASAMFGRRFGTEQDLSAPSYSGLQPALSDWIFAADATPLKGMRLFARLRLDGSTFAVNRLESGVSFALPRVEGYVAYLQERRSPIGQPISSLDVHGEAYVTRHWGVSSYAIIDSGAWRREDIGIVYRDDCIRVEVLYRHDETFNSTLGPTTSVVLRLSLATLGATR